LLSLSELGVSALSAEASSSTVACLSAHFDAPGKYVLDLYVAGALGGAGGLNASSSFIIFAQLFVFSACFFISTLASSRPLEFIEAIYYYQLFLVLLQLVIADMQLIQNYHLNY
jgi:hypothetical protein